MLAPDERLFPAAKHFLSHEMDRGCKKTGVKRIRVHDIRHSHSSLLINQGCDALILSDRLGHEKVSTTLNTYSHLFPHKQQELVSNLEQLAANVPNTTPPELPAENPLLDAAGIAYDTRDYDISTDVASITVPAGRLGEPFGSDLYKKAPKEIHSCAFNECFGSHLYGSDLVVKRRGSPFGFGFLCFLQRKHKK